jgi:uncharacterized membrane protein
MHKRFEMRRNCSFSPRQVGLFYLSMVTFSGVIATYFLWRGAWVILLFTCIELLVLGVALLIYARHATDHEIIDFTEHEVHIRCQLGLHRLEYRWHIPWVRVEGPDLARSEYPELVRMSYKGQSVHVGRFIRVEAREELAASLRLEINRRLI